MISKEIISETTSAIETVGVSIIVIGAFISLVQFLFNSLKKKSDAYECFRKKLGRTILIGLEFLVAADIVNTVAIKPSITSVATLGLIVLIRTFLSFSIEVELERRLPWKSQ